MQRVRLLPFHFETHCFMNNLRLIRSIRIIYSSHLVNAFRVLEHSIRPQIPSFCAIEPVFSSISLAVCALVFGSLLPAISLWCLSFTAPVSLCSTHQIIVGSTPNAPTEQTRRHDYGGYFWCSLPINLCARDSSNSDRALTKDPPASDGNLGLGWTLTVENWNELNGHLAKAKE